MKRHRFDPFSFLFGALFLTVGLTVATGASGVDAVRPFRSWPVAVILTGFVLVAWTVSRAVRAGTTAAGADTLEVADDVPDGGLAPGAPPDGAPPDGAPTDEVPPTPPAASER